MLQGLVYSIHIEPRQQRHPNIQHLLKNSVCFRIASRLLPKTIHITGSRCGTALLVLRRPSRHENRAMESRQSPGSDGKARHGLKAAMMRRGILPTSNDIINLGPPAIMLVYA